MSDPPLPRAPGKKKTARANPSRRNYRSFLRTFRRVPSWRVPWREAPHTRLRREALLKGRSGGAEPPQSKILAQSRPGNKLKTINQKTKKRYGNPWCRTPLSLAPPGKKIRRSGEPPHSDSNGDAWATASGTAAGGPEAARCRGTP